MSENLSALRSDVESLVRNVGHFIKSELGKVSAADIEAKALNSLVSYVDKRAEHLLVTELNNLLPDSGFVTEEDTIDDIDKENIWIIDPLDGTTNFLRQIPHFCVSVALERNGEIILGFVYNVMLDELFSAEKGKGAYLNGKKIQVSNTEDFSEAIIATGFPYEKLETASFIEVIQKILMTARGLRRMGAAALDMAYVACGRFDAYYECCLNPWDVAAGILLVKEAGGVVSDFSGGQDFFDGHEMVSGNPMTHKRVVEILKTSKSLNKA